MQNIRKFFAQAKEGPIQDRKYSDSTSIPTSSARQPAEEDSFMSGLTDNELDDGKYNIVLSDRGYELTGIRLQGRG